ncbi:MAG: transposase [Shewanella sp.]|nr:transposase [Shewanella sp.]
MFDATGLKVFKQGEWKMRQHGKEKRCTWPKLHLGVDGHSHFILCAGVSVEGLGDNQALPSMLRPMRRRIGQIYGDGAYDTKPCYDQIAKKKATPCIPPRSNADYWKGEHPRNAAVTALKAGKI